VRLTLGYRTHGIGPKITKAWDAYFEHNQEGVAGVDSVGDIVKTEQKCGEREKQVYETMMSNW
jgi:hypothetical protein